MPKAAFGLREFDSYLVLAPMVGLKVDDTAFPLFLCEAVHEQDGLTLLHTRCQGNQSAMSAYQVCLRNVSERMVVRRASVNTHGYAQGEALAAPLFLCLVGQTTLRLTLAAGLGNSTYAHRAKTPPARSMWLALRGLNRPPILTASVL